MSQKKYVHVKKVSVISGKSWLIVAPDEMSALISVGGTMLLAEQDPDIQLNQIIFSANPQRLTNANKEGSVLEVNEESTEKPEKKSICNSELVTKLGIQSCYCLGKEKDELSISPSLCAKFERILNYTKADTLLIPFLNEDFSEIAAENNESDSLKAGNSAFIWQLIQKVNFQGSIYAYETGVADSVNTLIDVTATIADKQKLLKQYAKDNGQKLSDIVAAGNRARTLSLIDNDSVDYVEGLFLFDKSYNSHLYHAINHLLPIYQSAIRAEHQPLISVIIRTKDRPVLLQEAVSCVMAQNYPNIELIVINDGGVDVREQLQEARFQLYHVNYQNLEINVGRAAAANTGLQQAKGDFILFLDDDDLIDVDHLSALNKAIQENSGVDVAYCGVRVGDTSIFNFPFNKEYLQAFNYIPIHAVLFSRKFIAMGCHFDEEMEAFEDWDFWIQLSQKSQFYHLDKISGDYRQLGDSDGGTFANNYNVEKNRYKVLNKWFSKLSIEQIDVLLKALRDYPSEKEVEMQQAVKGLQSALENKQNHLANLEQEILSERKLSSDANEALKHKKNHLAQLEQKVAEQSQLLLIERQLTCDLNEELKHKKNHLSHQEQQISEQSHQILSEQQLVSDLNEELKHKNNHLAYLEQQIVQREQEIVEHSQKILAEQQVVSDLNETLKHKNNHLALLEQQIAEQNQRFQSEHMRLQRKIDYLQEQSKKQAMEQQQLGVHNQQLSVHNQQLTAHIQHLESHIQQLDVEKQSLLTIIGLRDQELLNILHSKMWRITSPIRKTISLVRTLKQRSKTPVAATEIDTPSDIELDASAVNTEQNEATPIENDNSQSVATETPADPIENKNSGENNIPFEFSQVAAQQDTHHPLFSQLFAQSRGSGENYTGISAYPVNVPENLKYIAFYLPQYHPIPENDEWWGRGFTEWSNVSKATPQFEGHYQPHLPDELGYYDLRLYDVLKRQVELANHYGIHGFCFHHYWFGGKRLLERPFQHIMEHPELDVNFCLCWANENWTRRWDGLDQDILMAQQHSEEDDLAFIEEIEPVLKDKRYIRVNGKPLLILYRPSLLPDAAETLERWRQYCRNNDIGELFLVMAQVFGETDPRPFGFDAAVEFPPHGSGEITKEITSDVVLYNQQYAGNVFDYEDLVENTEQNISTPYPLFRALFPGWDNEARKPGKGNTFTHSTPLLYQNWLEKLSNYALNSPVEDESIVFINAWNEWGEGAHLEPDKKFGYSYLQATASMLQSYNQTFQQKLAATNQNLTKKHNIAVVLHLYYPELWEEINSHLQNISNGFDLYISVSKGIYTEYVDTILQSYPDAHLFGFENRGRDIAPFLEIMSRIWPLNYDSVCKLHSKKSLYFNDGGHWRSDLLSKLLGKVDEEDNLVDLVLEQFAANPKLGMLAPKGYWLPLQEHLGSNFETMTELMTRLGGQISTEAYFVAGSMFWFRPQSLETIVTLYLELSDFPYERGQRDGTLAHAMERLFSQVAEKNGYTVTELE